MAKAKQARAKVEAAAQVPQSRDEATRMVAEIGELQRARAVIQAQMNDELAAIKADYEAEALPLGERLSRLTQGVQIWAAANRDELTRGGRVKTAPLPSGEIAWRVRPPKVAIRGAEAVIDALRRLGLDRFVRTKAEISKEAILAEPEAVAMITGISISQGEDFVIKPFETALEEVA